MLGTQPPRRCNWSLPLALCVLLTVTSILGVSGVATAQQAAIFYVYDDLNRLSAVVNQQGDVAVYTYDAVGNILRIERFDASGLPGAVGISYFTPSVGREGTSVQIFGKGFAPTPGANTVTFNGAPAAVTAAAPNRLVAAVPAGATTGPIAVTAPLGSAVSATPFRVVGALAVTPGVTEVQATLTRQFEATEGGTPTSNVRWTVNGVAGGDPGAGTISASGLYTAPVTVPVPSGVTVAATHLDDASLTATAQVAVLAPGPQYGASRAVSVVFAAPAPVVDRSVTASVSVRLAAPSAQALAAGSPVSVAVAPTATMFSATPAVSIGLEPLVIGLSETAAPAGSSLTLTLAGAGLGAIDTITFLRNNVADSTITATNVTQSGDGTSVTADVAIAAGAPLGGRVVQVSGGGQSSTATPTGGNVFTVQ
jgi:YD repeat-containing protein